MIQSLAVFIFLLFANRASSFVSSSFGRLAQPSFYDISVQFKKKTRLIRLQTAGSDEISGEGNDSDSVGEDKRKMKLTSGRIGGRRKRVPRTTEVPTEPDNSRNKESFLSRFRTPALIALVLLLLRGFFSGGEPSEYYYSYSSTVYETRTYDSGGEVKTSRSESRSFKSNIPGMEQRQLFPSNYYLYDDY